MHKALAATYPAKVEEPIAVSLPRGAAILEQSVRRLSDLRNHRADDPVSNPVERLAFELSRDIDGGVLSLADLKELINALIVSGYMERVERLRVYVGGSGNDDLEARIRLVIRSLIKGKPGATPLPYSSFRNCVAGSSFGVVFTAHPTFAVPERLMESLAQLATGTDQVGRALTEKATQTLLSEAMKSQHCNDMAPTLRDELAAASRATARCRTALDRAHRILLEEAREAYPDQWSDLVPRLVTVASWTGYDLDGRVDLSWADILRARTDSAMRMARHYAERLGALANFVRSGPAVDLMALAVSARTTAEDLVQLSELLAHANGDTEAARAVGRRLVALEQKLFDPVETDQALAEIAASLGGDAQIEAQLIRTELRNFGLSEARVHFRVNAVQLSNALHGEIAADGSTNGGESRRRLARMDALFDTVEAQTVNIGSVAAEPTTARRMMMLASLIRRHIDRAQPIRFLIAECDEPFTVLAALYLARLFGVDDIVDISPLFETRIALERGPDLIARLLKNPHYRAYIEKRGCLAIQMGYSDGGRAIGQISVSLAIERLRIKIAQILAKEGLHDIDLITFDTHGESLGRGSHPGSLAERFAYVDTPHGRRLMEELEVRHSQETSFQGGDGYLLFGNATIAMATVCAIIEHWLEPVPVEIDPFYTDRDYSLEFFLDMCAFNESLGGDVNYAYWLSTWAQSVLPPSGSRAVSRPNEERKSVFDMRAIPHNASLQQMGMLVNSLAGVGAALAADPDRAAEMHEVSPRFRSLIELVARAREVSSVDAMGAYADLLNPVKWLRRAALAEGQNRSPRMRKVAHALAVHGHYREANAFMHRVFDDLLDLDKVLALCGYDTSLAAGGIMLDLMHAVRLTLARRILLLYAEIPSFTPRPDVDPDRIERDLVVFDVPRAVATLRIVFPASPALVVDESFGEAASYRNDGQAGYRHLHEKVFDQLETCHKMLRGIGSAITHYIGAFG
jgi:phosphoenolpyruvate carboxylase